MEPLRVEVVTPFGTSAVTGGAEKWLLSMVDNTQRLQVQLLLLQDGPLLHQARQAGIPARVQPTGSSALSLMMAGIRLGAHLRRQRPDVVVGNGVKAQVVVAVASMVAGARTVWVKHDHSYDRLLAKPLGRLADAVIATVEEVAEPVGRDDVIVIHPPAQVMECATRDQARAHLQKLGVHLDQRPTLVMAGRLVPYKGVDDAITGLAMPGGEGWRLVVLGDDDQSSPGETERLGRLAQDKGVVDRVTLGSPVDGLAHWLSAFDALAVLTKAGGRRTPGREGFGMTAFEAMQARLPVVAVEGGAVVRRLAGVAGIGVPAADPAALASALGRLRDPALRSAMGAAGHDLVRRHPTAIRAADHFADALATAALRPGAGSRPGPPVSVVVPVYNEGAAVEPMLSALIAQLRGADEILVVDDGSTDDTARRAVRLAAADPEHVHLLRQPDNRGAGAARNVGVHRSRHEVIAFTDAGCIPSANWLSAIRSAFTQDPRPDLISGVYEVIARTAFERAMAVAGYPSLFETRHPDAVNRVYGRVFGRVFDATRPAGRSMAVSRDAFDRVGGFRTGREAAEDIDFARAIAATGGQCLLAVDACVTWEQRPSMATTARMYYRYGRGDATSADTQAIARDLLRAGVYLVLPVAFSRGRGLTRTLAGLAIASYLSVPMRRAARTPQRAGVLLSIPVAVALKDVAKGLGCLVGLPGRRRRRLDHSVRGN